MTAFGRIGNYTEFAPYWVNLYDCGLSVKPTVHNYTFNTNCFRNKYIPKTLYDVEGNNLMYERLESPPQTRILFGEKATLTEAPWAIYVTNERWSNFDFRKHISTWGNDDYWACSGSLVTLSWVVTAAHCLEHNMT